LPCLLRFTLAVSVSVAEKSTARGDAPLDDPEPQAHLGAMIHDDATLRPEFLPAAPERPTGPALRRGLRQSCPSCGEGHLFDGYLKLRQTCPSCDEDLSHARADDGPAYLSILLTAKVMGTLQLVTYEMWQPSPWVMASTFSVGVVAMALYLLPRFKGMIVGIQWAKRMNGF
jgi:uncharacterized protein (DUF983 family)